MKRNIFRHVGSLVFLLVSAIAAYWLVTNRQQVVDTVALWNYQPSSQVVSIADRTAMTAAGRSLFYVSHPSLDDAQTFNKACGNSEQGAAVLGCYTGLRIYIYNVSDPQLDGIHEVTAAHEMLHAAYARMSDTDKKDVNALLEGEYETLSKDPAFAERMALYARTEPGERDNELHSIIGTEVAPVSPELEAHYAKYFVKRATVVALHDQYLSVFTRLKAESVKLSDQMSQLSAEIKSRSGAYDTASQQLNADIATFNQRVSGGDIQSQEQFNSERRALVARVAKMSAERSAINSLVNQFNQIVNQYNAIATQTEQLNQSINSSLAPAPSL